MLSGKQCSGSMTFWRGSGSGDPCLSLMDPDYDPDPAHFRHRPSRCQQKTNFLSLLLFEGTFASFLIDKESKRSNKTVGIKVFCTTFGILLADLLLSDVNPKPSF